MCYEAPVACGFVSALEDAGSLIATTRVIRAAGQFAIGSAPALALKGAVAGFVVDLGAQGADCCDAAPTILLQQPLPGGTMHHLTTPRGIIRASATTLVVVGSGRVTDAEGLVLLDNAPALAVVTLAATGSALELGTCPVVHVGNGVTASAEAYYDVVLDPCAPCTRVYVCGVALGEADTEVPTVHLVDVVSGMSLVHIVHPTVAGVAVSLISFGSWLVVGVNVVDDGALVWTIAPSPGLELATVPDTGFNDPTTGRLRLGDVPNALAPTPVIIRVLTGGPNAYVVTRMNVSVAAPSPITLLAVYGFGSDTAPLTVTTWASEDSGVTNRTEPTDAVWAAGGLVVVGNLYLSMVAGESYVYPALPHLDAVDVGPPAPFCVHLPVLPCTKPPRCVFSNLAGCTNARIANAVTLGTSGGVGVRVVGDVFANAFVAGEPAGVLNVFVGLGCAPKILNGTSCLGVTRGISDTPQWAAGPLVVASTSTEVAVPIPGTLVFDATLGVLRLFNGATWVALS